MEGLEKLENEVLEMNDNSISKIFEYLKTRKDLYEKFKSEEKSIEEMYKFIYDKARVHAKNNVAVIDDRIVYLWAVTYFNKSNEELGIKKVKAVKVMPPTATEVIEKFEKKENNQVSIFEEVDK